MNRLISIDPGVAWLGASAFDMPTKRLLEARRFRGTGFKGELWRLHDLVTEVAAWAKGFGPIGALAMEWPQVYNKHQRGKKDPNDLLPLAGIDTALLFALDYWMVDGADCTIYLPHDWKGSKQANPTARAILSRLDEHEYAAVEDHADFEAALRAAEETETEIAHPAHNTVDAVGIGLKFLGRFERYRAIAR